MAHQILKYTSEQREDDPSLRLGAELAALFAGELNPVAPKAQRKVPVPEGLDLDAWINEPPTPTRSGSDSLYSDSSESLAAAAGGASARKGKGKGASGKSKHDAGPAAGKGTPGSGSAAGGARFFALGNAFGNDNVSGERHSVTNEQKRPEPTPEELEKVCL